MFPISVVAQQITDTSYQPPIMNPAYPPGTGPIVFIDQGHHNFHTRSGRYKPFTQLLERDGYQVKDYSGEFLKLKLDQGDILVISNALHERNIQNWINPCPSAFTPEEINTIEVWVREGGCLFLIADHMPMGGAAKDLAAAFGFKFYNGFAFDSLTQGVISFSREDGTLLPNAITNGEANHDFIDQVTTFTGQAFIIPEDAKSILKFDQGDYLLMPDTAWQFHPDTRRIAIDGWAQGAFKHHRKGKVVMFGEAAMFSAQLAGPNQIKVGMNAPQAKDNYKLLLNIMHWLD
jgi:hypothetical protein